MLGILYFPPERIRFVLFFIITDFFSRSGMYLSSCHFEKDLVFYSYEV